MIVRMTKATVLVVDANRERELARLKRLGVLHPHVEQRADERLEKVRSRLEQVQRALASLPAAANGAGPAGAPAADQAEATADRACELAERVGAAVERIRSHREALEKIDAEIARVAPWGDFDPALLETLGSRGIDVRLFTMPPRDFRRSGLEGAIVLERTRAAVRFAMVWVRGEHPSGAAVEDVSAGSGVVVFRPPAESARAFQRKVDERRAEIERARNELESLADGRRLLEAAAELLERSIRDEQIRLGMDTAEPVAYLTGFLPSEEVDALKQAAADNGWGLLLSEPTDEDPVPTKIRTPRPVRIIRPIFNLLGVVPGYREQDISFLFLAFFTVFVGMIIGDAGYGSLLFAGAIALLLGSRGKPKEGPTLLLVLSLSTIAWGALSGNWFGYEPIGRMVPFSYAALPALDAFDPATVENVQLVCFVLAVVHLSIAHIWRFLVQIRQKPRLRALAQLGWLAVVDSLFLVVLALFLGMPFPGAGLYVLGGGMITVFLFSEQAGDGFFRGLGRSLGAGLLPTVFSGIGAFSDIISYIRLFAIGMASVAIAQAFNQLASGAGVAGAVIILFLGHSLNLIMGGLGVVVHGVRLNVLEFAGHLGMEWTGTEYRPYRED